MMQIRKCMFLLVAVSLFASCRTGAGESTLNEATAPSCEAKVSDSSCDYYSCLEQAKECGESGYPVGYGQRYCKKFRGLCDGALTSAKAKRWVKGTTACLQKQLAEVEPEIGDCDDLANRAFASHAYCYASGTTTFGGVSFCELGPFDWAAIRGCVSASDRYSVRGSQQIVQTALRCINIFSGGFLLQGDDGDEAERRLAASLTPEQRRQRVAELKAFLSNSEKQNQIP